MTGPGRPTPGRTTVVLGAVLAVALLVVAGLVGALLRGGGPATSAGPVATVRDGVTQLRAPLVVDRAHPLLCGRPGACTLRPAPGYTGVLVTTAGGQASTAHHPGIRIDGLRIDCAQQAAQGIFLRSPDDLVLSRVEVTGCRTTKELEGALQVRGNGTKDLTEGLRLSDLDVHDNAGNGLHVGYGVRATTYRGIRADHNGMDGVVVDGSEATLSDVRARGNGGTGIFFRNLVNIDGDGLVATGNQTGIRAITLVAARLDVLVQDNAMDVHFDDLLLGGCDASASIACTTNYGHTRDVVLSGVLGPNDFKMSGEQARPGERPLVVDPHSVVDTTRVLVTTASAGRDDTSGG